jgi:uncharacterized protein YciI
MLYMVLFTDNPDREEARTRLIQAHLDFLERNRARVRAAGPLRDAGAPVGGAWLVEAASPDEVVTLYKEDPFWPTGLRQSVRVLEWTQVFADGRRKIKA